MFRDDWLKWGFGPALLPYAPNHPFVIDYQGAEADHMGRSALDIAVLAAQHIYETMPKPITLIVSGGIDSQAMAYAFKMSGVPHRLVTARYNDGLNAHEFETAPFYRRHTIAVEVMDLDVIQFHRHELRLWAERYQNNSPHILCHMKIASRLEGTIVSGGSAIRRKPVVGSLSYSTFGLERYSRISGQPMIPYFFQYDPRLVHALATLPVDATIDSYECKVQQYQRGGFPVLPQRTKYHGFEKIKAVFDGHLVDSKARLRYASQNSKRPYDLLFRYPLAEIARYSEYGSFLLPPEFP